MPSAPLEGTFTPGNSPHPAISLVFPTVLSFCCPLYSCISVKSRGNLTQRHLAPLTASSLEYLRSVILPSRCNFFLTLIYLLIKNYPQRITELNLLLILLEFKELASHHCLFPQISAFLQVLSNLFTLNYRNTYLYLPFFCSSGMRFSSISSSSVCRGNSLQPLAGNGVGETFPLDHSELPEPRADAGYSGWNSEERCLPQ